jgi:FAD synthetase
LQTIEEALEKYTISNAWICFNGGKDCTALLHLVHAVMKKKYPQTGVKVPALCIRGDNPFPEMEDFIQDASSR